MLAIIMTLAHPEEQRLRRVSKEEQEARLHGSRPRTGQRKRCRERASYRGGQRYTRNSFA
jgi:hypothetical protein